MSQHDFSIANQTASNARTDINNALQALASMNSGTTAPSTTYANMLWYETDTNILKMRNEANSAWVNIAYIDQSNGLEILDDTHLVNTSGTQTGLLGGQTQTTWNTGTGTTESLISPAQLKAAINNVVNSGALGVNQTWQDMSGSRTSNTAYQNTTGRPIQISVGWALSNVAEIKVSSDGTNYVTVTYTSYSSDYHDVAPIIIPDDHYYKLEGSGTITIGRWAELR